MDKASCKCDPQVGTRKGESHPSATVEGSPSYSGGGNNCLVGRQSVDLRQHDSCISIPDTELPNEKMPVAQAATKRVRQVRARAAAPPTPAVSSDAGELSDSSVMSGASEQSTAMSVGARKRTLPASGSEGERPKRKAAKSQKRNDFLVPLVPVAQTGSNVSLPSAEELSREMTEQLTGDLGSRITENLEIIEKVTDKPRNLKGDMVRAIRVAVRNIQAASNEVVQRATTAHLEQENATLRSQLANLSRRVEALTAELSQLRRNAPNGPALVAVEPKRTGRCNDAFMDKIGSMIDRKLADFRDELFPGRAIRPPLGHKATSTASMPIPTTVVSVPPPVASSSGAQTSGMDATWSKVVGRKARAKARKLAQMASTRRQSPSHGRGKSASHWHPTAIPLRVTEPAQLEKRKTAQKKKKLPRMPKSAAVTVTVPEGSHATYAQVMTAAKSQIQLPDLGITEIRQKKALNGGLLLEVAGENCAEKADALAGKLHEVVAEMGVKVARPSKQGEARVMDLDDSVTQQEIASAIAAACGCVAGDIKVGEIRRRPSALGTAWVRCPLTAIRKLASAKRVLIGWVSARVKVLPARSLQCFRCLETGHARYQCTSATDRSTLCFVCGEPNHKANQCGALSPKCALCADFGLPANHRLGSKHCKPPKKKTRGDRGTERATTTASSTRADGLAHTSASSHCPIEEVMDT